MHICQRQTGSTSVVNVFYESDRIIPSGAVIEHVVEAGIGQPHIVRRYASCGTAILSHYARFGRLSAGLRAGTPDDPGAMRPSAAIFTASRMPWVVLPEGVPAFEAHYRPSDFLPEASLSRFRALAARQDALKDVAA
ncbi:MAG TPA: GFA family protein [Sphingobium sp.]